MAGELCINYLWLCVTFRASSAARRLCDASNTPTDTISAASASSPRDAASSAAYAASTASSCSRDCFSGPAGSLPGGRWRTVDT